MQGIVHECYEEERPGHDCLVYGVYPSGRSLHSLVCCRAQDVLVAGLPSWWNKMQKLDYLPSWDLQTEPSGESAITQSCTAQRGLKEVS